MTPTKPNIILAFFSHPDDESFGPGGSIAHWVLQGATVHLVCATKGEVGGKASVRTKELQHAAQVLGISSVTFLKYKDGQIGNNALLQLEKDFIHYIKKYKPDSLLTYDFNGVSGHIDHIAVASATTQAFKKSSYPKQLLYYTIPKAKSNLMRDYFIYFPDGKVKDQVDLVVNVSHVWKQKVSAMKKHKSQMHDVKRILLQSLVFPKEEWFTVRTKNETIQSIRNIVTLKGAR